jgi:hypothetical protein
MLLPSMKERLDVSPSAASARHGMFDGIVQLTPP